MSLRPTLAVDVAQGVVLSANRAAEAFWGYGEREFANKPLRELIDAASTQALLTAARAAQADFALPSVTLVQSSRATHVVSLAASRQADSLWACAFHEQNRISKQMELQRLNWALNAFARSSASLIHLSDTQSLMRQVCEAIVGQEPYILACVALPDKQDEPWLEFVAAAGPATGYLDGLRLTASADHPEGQGATGRTLRSGTPNLIRDSRKDAVYSLWREKGAKFGIRSTVTVPIRVAGETVGALLVYASRPNAFGPTELNLFWRLCEEMGLAMAIQADRARMLEIEAARRLAEERAQIANAELQRFARISFLGEFAAALAHEINQPIGATKINAEAALRWLDRQPPDLDEVRLALQRIGRDAMRANEIILRTRAMYGSGETAFAAFDLRVAIEEVLPTVLDLQRRTGFTLRFAPGVAREEVHGDRIQIQQVVYNLLVNAADAMADVLDRPRTLDVTLGREAQHALVSVEDSGAGVAAEAKARIFDRFYTTKPQGTGLGLALSKRIVEAHGGRMWFENRAPVGARFLFTLPLAATRAQQTNKPGNAASS